MSQPKRVTILQMSVFVCGLWNLGRVIQLVQSREVLSQFNATISPNLRLMIATIWLIAFMMWFIWGRRWWNGRYWYAMPLTFLLYGASELALTIWQTNASSWLLETIFHTLLIVYSYWATSPEKKETKGNK